MARKHRRLWWWSVGALLLLSAELLGFSTAILMGVGLISGLLPALRASRLNPIEAL